MNPCHRPRLVGPRLATSLIVVTLLSLALLTGCGGGDKNDNAGESLVLATVGNTDITAADYEKGLAKLDMKELPKGDDGLPVDTATEEGKLEFLQVLINKEILSQKAYQMGYDKDPQAVSARSSLLGYHAGLALWDDVVGEQARTISEEELQAFYENMGKVRSVRYLITNFEDDALKAQAMAQGGADWMDVVNKYHDGVKSDHGYTLDVGFGQYAPEFEDPVFETPLGDVTPPVHTQSGYWVMLVEDEKMTQKPDLEAAKARILDITYNRKVGRAREDFKEQLRKDYKLNIDDDVLWICYQGIPEGGLMDEKTNKPRTKESLEPLNVPLKDMDRVFYSYEMNGEVFEYTLGDYKGHFDNMSVFQQPKRTDMMGGLRRHIINELERAFVDDAARKRGFYEDPDVLAKVDEKVEEIMVTKLYTEQVQYDERVTADDLEAFWQEHKDEYAMPETREGLVVYCISEKEALQAKAEADQGRDWAAILQSYGTDRENKAKGGRTPALRLRGDNPVVVALFELGLGEVSEPVMLENGRLAVIKLEKVNPPRQIEKIEVSEQLGKRITNIRQEEAFQALLDKWGGELGVKRYPENLAGLKDWETITARVIPENHTAVKRR